jgi:hypothetical protein
LPPLTIPANPCWAGRLTLTVATFDDSMIDMIYTLAGLDHLEFVQ